MRACLCTVWFELATFDGPAFSVLCAVFGCVVFIPQMAKSGDMSPSPSGEHVGQLRGWSVLNRKGGVKAVLCGDLGGTNSRLVLYEVPPLYEGGDAAPEKPTLERRSSRSWYFRSIAGGGGDQAAAAEPAGGGDGGGGGRKLIPLAHRQAQLATVGSQYPIFKPKAYKNELFDSFSAVVHEFIRESGCVASHLFFLFVQQRPK